MSDADAPAALAGACDSADRSRCYPQLINAVVSFDYQIGPSALHELYEKSKERQWNATTAFDWTQGLDHDNPLGLPASTFPLGRTEWFAALPPAVQHQVVREYQGWMVSQFLHGEQFGVLSASRIALEALDHDSKLFATAQAGDEARHLETYARLTEQIGVRYPVSRPFGKFLDEVICAPQVDLVYLGLQVIGEGIGLASFSQIRQYTTSPLIRSIYARIMEDEARHVAFGRQFLRAAYRELDAAEMKHREAFVVEACELMVERFYALEVWERFGLPRTQAQELLRRSASFRIYRRELFNQIVPVIRDIGLWSERIQQLFGSLGVPARDRVV